MSEIEQIVYNTHHQLAYSGGGVAITQYWGGIREKYRHGWTVYRINAQGKEVITDQNASWYHYGRKWFAPPNGKFHEREKAALADAIKWVAEQGWYTGEWAKNRQGDYVPAEVQKKFPIRRNP